MGRASRKKWEGRLKAAFAAGSKQTQSPWFESNLLWGSLGLGGGIVFTVIAAMTKDLRWLLVFAWPLFSLAAWSILRSFITSQKIVLICLLLISAGIAFSLYKLKETLNPPPVEKPLATEQVRPPSAAELADEVLKRLPKTDDRYQRATLQPNINMSVFYDQHGSSIRLSNNGPGPAVKKWFAVYIDNRPQRNWDEFAATLEIPEFRFSYPSEQIASKAGFPLFVVLPEHTPTLLKNMDRVRMEICYCSTYEGCWISTIKKGEPTRESTCKPEPKVRFGG